LGQQRTAVPEAEVAEGFLDDGTMVNDGDDGRGVLALRAAEARRRSPQGRKAANQIGWRIGSRVSG
jgi:hypothetical protein